MLNALLLAFKNLFKTPQTTTYPVNPTPKPENYRGLIEYSEASCIFCDKCEKVCPPHAILFTQAPNGDKTYHYNPWLCIYCGECVRACPKPNEALWQSTTKASPALKDHDVNNQWFELEREAKASRAAYKASKTSR